MEQMMDLIVDSASKARWGNRVLKCAIGSAGAILAKDKREGDNRTPVGRWPMREVYYRPDRVMAPITKLPIHEINPKDAWCENGADSNYNKLVQIPYRVRVDSLWRNDEIYNVFVVLGYNDRPVEAGLGSAIFLHVARPDFSPTVGCVAIKQNDLLGILKEVDENSCVEITAPVLEETIKKEEAAAASPITDIDWDALFETVP
jgi:L,D-peptidoglycan transpeptidase YkuD (ErfK/YbiS/YcfS/YnhG family)